MKRNSIGIACAGIVAMLGSSLAYGANIGLSFVGAGNTSDTLTSGQTAGVTPQSGWNNTSAGAKSAIVTAFADTVPTAYVTMNYSGSSTYNAVNGGGTINTANGDEILNNGGIYTGGVGTPNTVTVSGIASVGSSYNVYAYLMTDHPANLSVTLTPTSGSVQGPIFLTTPNANAPGYFDNSASGFTYTPGTSTVSASPTLNADYVVFNLPSTVTGFTLSESLTATTAGATNGTLDAIQLAGVVPEPASIGLLASAALGLLVRRRNHKNIA